MSTCQVHEAPASACDCPPPTTAKKSATPTLDPAALHGPLGHIAETLAGHSEASLPAILATVVTRSATDLADRAWLPVNAAGRLTTRTFTVLVGTSGSARKGSAERDVRALWSIVRPEDDPITGLSSGEGLIASLAHRTAESPGVGTLVVAEELARVLTVMGRDSNTLSAVLRELFDSGSASVLTRAEPLKVTGAHLGILAHITAEELATKLRSVDAANGFANRFLWVLVARGQVLPTGGTADAATLHHLAVDWQRALDAAHRIAGPVTRSPDALEAWRAFYLEHANRRDPGGMHSALTSRAEAHAAKLSLLYALMDGCSRIEVQHHDAGLALWEYADQSLRQLFPPNATGDPIANRILELARLNGGRLPWSGIYEHGHKLKATDVDTAVETLVTRGLATIEEHPRGDGTAGRPRRVVLLREPS